MSRHALQCSHADCSTTFSHPKLSMIADEARAAGWVDAWRRPRCPAHAPVTMPKTKRESTAYGALATYAEHPNTDPAAAATARVMLNEWRDAAKRRTA